MTAQGIAVLVAWWGFLAAFWRYERRTRPAASIRPATNQEVTK